MAGAEATYKTLYVKNFDRKVDENTLKCIFGLYGLVTSVKVIRNTKGASRGFGFITFADHKSAEKAVKACHGSIVYGKSLFVGRAKSRAELEQMIPPTYSDSSVANLYVKQLDPRIDDNFLRTLFSVYGNVLSSKVMRTENGVSRGFGFVSFSTTEDAFRAMDNLNGRMFFTKPLHVTVAQKGDDRKAMLDAVWNKKKNIKSEEKCKRDFLPFSEKDFPRLISKEEDDVLKFLT